MDKLIERINKEQEEYLNRIKQLTPEEIIAKAYEICYREEFIIILENEEFDDKTVAILSATPNILNTLYGEWLDTDGGVTEMLTDVITTFVEEEMNNG